MNIFALDRDPKLAAQYHCDKHVVKMILEYTQMLLMTYYRASKILTRKDYESDKGLVNEIFKSFPRKNIDGSPDPYKISHMNHPCTVWTFQSRNNFEWLLDLLKYTHQEYSSRYNRQHACYPILCWILVTHHTLKFQNTELTPFALAMPDHCKEDDPVESYRQYYIKEKSSFCKWSYPSTTPEWYVVKEES